MISREIIIFFGVVLQQFPPAVHGNYNTTIWESFEWKITVHRRKQDNIIIRGLLDEGLAQDEVHIQGATCGVAEKWTESAKLDLPGFVMQCKCDSKSSTFDPKHKRCMKNSEIKQGCFFTTGSWRWNTSWSWDAVDDELLIFDNKRDYGIIAGFNVSPTEYPSCSVVSIGYWSGESLNWTVASDFLFNDSKPVIFKLHNMWHFLWNVEDMRSELKERLTGKILRFFIECEKPGPPKDEDEVLEIISCLVLKVSGELNFTSKHWDFPVHPTKDTEARKPSTNDPDALLIALLIPLVIILLIIGVLSAVCYIRRTACFSEQETLRHATTLDDEVIQTKLLKNVAEESFV